MLSLNDIPFEDILSFLINTNTVAVTNINDTSSSIMHRLKTNTAFISAFDTWRLSQALNINLPVFKSSDILKSNDHNLYDLSVALKLQFPNKTEIIRVLGHLDRLNNDMNVFDFIPHEILQIILFELNYKAIKSIIPLISLRFSKLNLTELLQRRITKGYPRHQGFCDVHIIPQNIMKIITNNMITTREIILNKGIDYLCTKNIDIIKGDILIIESYHGISINAIFDGCRAITIEHYSNSKSRKRVMLLAPTCHVIEDNVPIKYWNYENSVYGINIYHVWFNHLLVQDECISNIQYGLINDKYAIFTTFVYDDIIYKIVFAYYYPSNTMNRNNFQILNDKHIEKCIGMFTNAMRETKNIMFRCTCAAYEGISCNNTLFIDFNEI